MSKLTQEQIEIVFKFIDMLCKIFPKEMEDIIWDIKDKLY